MPWTTATECTLHGGKRLFDFSICIFFSFLILLFALFTVELIPWMFCHDNILNIVYRITMCYANWNILDRETTHCFSHNAQTHICTDTLNGSFVGSLVSILYLCISSDLKFKTISRVCRTLFKIYVSLTHTVNVPLFALGYAVDFPANHCTSIQHAICRFALDAEIQYTYESNRTMYTWI